MLLFFQFGLGGSTYFDDGNAAGEFRQALVELLAVVVAGGLINLNADLFDAALDVGAVALTANDGGVVFGGNNLFALTEVSNGGRFEFAAGFLGNHGRAGQDGDILQHGFAAVAETGGFDSQHVEHAAQLVEHEGGQGFAINIFGDHDQLALAALDHLFQQGDQICSSRDLLVMDQQVWFFDHRFHRFGIGHEVRGEVAAVELHTFDIIGLELKSLGILNGNHAIIADFIEDFGDQFADLPVLGGY